MHIHRKQEFQILGLTHQEMVWVSKSIIRGLSSPLANEVNALAVTDEERRFLARLRMDIDKETRYQSGTGAAVHHE